MWPFNTPYPDRSTQQLSEQYDYIVVGGGTAGCVLARRLAENRTSSVLLIERGDAGNSWLHRCPLLSMYHLSDGKHTTTMEATNNPNLKRPTTLVAGIGLGGTTRINSTQYSRGPPAEYDAWPQYGCEGWGYKDLVPYFEKAECLYNAAERTHYGRGGPWQIQIPSPLQSTASERFTQAAEKLGFANYQDVNDPSMPTLGCFRIHHTVDRNGERSSTFTAYLPKQFVLDHENLHICTRGLVRKVNISASSTGELEAVGVVLQSHERGSPSVSIVARKEVILAAGALSTPQLLLLSGVGPEKHLAEVGIPLVKHLNGVGSSLQDHFGVHLDFNCPIQDSALAMARNPLTLFSQFFKYLLKGEGWFTSASILEASVLARSDLLDDETYSLQPSTHDNRDSPSPGSIPDIEIMAVLISDPRHPKFQSNMGGFSFFTALLRPISKGTIRLRSSDPFDQPLCDMQYLSSPSEYLVLRRALRLCMNLSVEMRASGYDLRDVMVPESTDDASLDAFINEVGDTLYHYSGSCRMGEEGDPVSPGVVDRTLHVHGIKALRVCDASVFPGILATHLQAPVVAIAEKCADLIKTANLL